MTIQKSDYIETNFDQKIEKPQSERKISPTDFLSMQVSLKMDESTGRLSELKLPHPLSVCYSITNQCNRSCAHCLPMSNINASKGLETEQVQELFEKLKDSGVQRIAIVGGEPFLRKDLVDIIKYATQNLNLEIIVTTHGGFITEEIAEQLAPLGIIVQVSIDGDEETNDELRGNKSYSKAVEAVKILVSKKIPTQICCTIQKRNEDSAVQYVANLADNLKVNGVYINFLCPRGGAKENQCLSMKEQDSFRERVDEICRENKKYAELLELKKADRSGVFIDDKGNFISQRFTEGETEIIGNALIDDIKLMWAEVKVDHVVHLLQFLQHPLIYKR